MNVIQVRQCSRRSLPARSRQIQGRVARIGRDRRRSTRSSGRAGSPDQLIADQKAHGEQQDEREQVRNEIVDVHRRREEHQQRTAHEQRGVVDACERDEPPEGSLAGFAAAKHPELVEREVPGGGALRRDDRRKQVVDASQTDESPQESLVHEYPRRSHKRECDEGVAVFACCPATAKAAFLDPSIRGWDQPCVGAHDPSFSR